jgi:hypothetical protein
MVTMRELMMRMDDESNQNQLVELVMASFRPASNIRGKKQGISLQAHGRTGL